MTPGESTRPWPDTPMVVRMPALASAAKVPNTTRFMRSPRRFSPSGPPTPPSFYLASLERRDGELTDSNRAAETGPHRRGGGDAGIVAGLLEADLSVDDDA